MSRLWLLLRAVAVCGQEKLVDGDSWQDLERRLDDGIGLGKLVVRWRMRGSQRDWRRLQVYQKLEWKPGSGQELFAWAERAPERLIGVNLAVSTKHYRENWVKSS